MNNDIFNPMELDAIGEIMNISLGSSATAVSNMLDHRVDITTPSVTVVNAEDFSLGSLEPAIGVEIKYVSGLAGSNILLLKMSDIKVIVDTLMGVETPEEEFVLNDLTLSAVCEVMNQMMGAASTALSDFLGRMVNISTPQTFDLGDLDSFKKDRLPAQNGPVVVVSFALSIESKLKSEFMNVMSVELARELVTGFGLDHSQPEQSVEAGKTVEAAPSGANVSGDGSREREGGKLSQEDIERLMGKMAVKEEKVQATPQGAEPAADQQPAAPYYPPYPACYPPGVTAEQAAGMTLPPAPDGAGAPYYPGYYGQPYYGWPGAPVMQPPQASPEPKVINTQPPAMPKLDSGEPLGQEQAQNLDLIMNVPLEITVEIGRTRKLVKDILSFSKGSLVVLNKLAGDQVDLFVNGKCIARGDVVVIDDNFGIRISEILKKSELEEVAQQL